jgi:hypothetical protein
MILELTFLLRDQTSTSFIVFSGEMWDYGVIKHHFETNMCHISLKSARKNQRKQEMRIPKETK